MPICWVAGIWHLTAYPPTIQGLATHAGRRTTTSLVSASWGSQPCTTVMLAMSYWVWPGSQQRPNMNLGRGGGGREALAVATLSSTRPETFPHLHWGLYLAPPSLTPSLIAQTIAHMLTFNYIKLFRFKSVTV